MARRARWVRFGLADPQELRAVGAALSVAQSRSAAPIVLWSRTRPGFDDGVADDPSQFAFVVVVPLRLAPGKPVRWPAWALSPAVAVYRDFGLRAYLNGTDICAQGERIASSCASRFHGCAVIACSLGGDFRRGGLHSPATDRATEFRGWLREGLGLTMTQWGGEGDGPPERALETALRARIEAQHAWQFENSWPDSSERLAIEAARGSAFGFAAGLELRAADSALSQASFAE